MESRKHTRLAIIVSFALLITMGLAACAISSASMNASDGKTVEEQAAQAYINDYIASIEPSGYPSAFKITDIDIVRFDRIAEYGDMYPYPLELWQLDFHLKPDHVEFVRNDVRIEDGWITESNDSKPLMVFSKENGTTKYLGDISFGILLATNTDVPAGREMAVRMYLEEIGLLPHVTYPGTHYLVNARLSDGSPIQLLLSQPADKGDTGIWCVERWRDLSGNNNLYYEYPPAGWTDKPIAEYYADLQRQSNKALETGSTNSLIQPREVARAFLSDNLGQQRPVIEDMFLLHTETDDPFSLTVMKGYISDFDANNGSFIFNEIEFVSEQDRADVLRVELNPNGFYLYNMETGKKTVPFDQITLFRLLNVNDSLSSWQSMSAAQFENGYNKISPLYQIEIKNGKAACVIEQYIP